MLISSNTTVINDGYYYKTQTRVKLNEVSLLDLTESGSCNSVLIEDA